MMSEKVGKEKTFDINILGVKQHNLGITKASNKPCPLGPVDPLRQ